MQDKYNQPPPQMYPPPPPPPPPCYPPSPYPNPYPPSPYPYPNPYPQPYNNYYYQQQQQSKPPLVHDSDSGAASFGRVLLILMLSIIGSMMMMSMIMWLFFGASIPDFEVASISVSNFTATNTSLSGSWSVGMWVSNVNMKVDVDFHHGMSSIFYKNSLLGVAAMEPFLVRKTQRFGLNFTVPAMRMQDDQKLQNWVLPALAEDRSDGAVAFSLGMAVDANFTAPDVDYRKESLRILCEDLEIRFPSPTSGEGTWSQGLGRPCYIRLHESHD